MVNIINTVNIIGSTQLMMIMMKVNDESVPLVYCDVQLCIVGSAITVAVICWHLKLSTNEPAAILCSISLNVTVSMAPWNPGILSMSL